MRINELFESVADLKSEIENNINHGEIVKPDFDRLKQRFSKELSKAGEEIARTYVHGRGQELYNLDPALSELSYSIPQYGASFVEVIRLPKKIAAVKTKHPLVDALKAFAAEWLPAAEKLQTLKGMVVTTATKRAEKKAAAEKEQKKKFSDSSSLVATLTKHREEFVQAAGERAADEYRRIVAFVKKNGGIDVVAPKPTARMSREAYRTAAAKRQYLEQITSTSLKDYVAEFERAADDDYMAWVAKLTNKIGKPVVKSSMSGSPWTGSTIEVTTDDGDKQTWVTKMIINQSKYGKPFNQFPTRKLR